MSTLPLTTEELARLQSEKDQIVRALRDKERAAQPQSREPETVVAAPEAPAVLQKFVMKIAEADTGKIDARKAEAQKAEGGMVAEARSLIGKHAKMVQTHKKRVELAAALDYEAIRLATPETLTFDPESRSMRCL